MCDIEGELDPWLLTEDELEYEVRIRNLKIGTRSQKDATLKRTLLSGYIARNQNFDLLVDEDFNLQYQTDFIKNTLTVLEKLIEGFSGKESDLQCRSFRARLISLFFRIKRFQIPEDEQEEYQDLVNDWTCKCMELGTILLFKVSPHLKPGARYTNPNVIPLSLPSTSGGSNQSQQPVIVPISLPVSSGTPVCKWGVTFSEDSSVKAFLERITELSEARSVSSEQLFKSAIDLFEGPALTWFRANKGRFHSWEDIVTGLLDSFLPSDYDEILLSQIKGRFQGKNETVNLFVAKMQNLFSRLTTPPGIIDQLKIIRRNLLPKYVNALVLQDIKTIPELLNFCKLIDESSQIRSRYVPSSAANCLETDLVCVDEESPSCSGLSSVANIHDGKDNSNFKNRIAVICFNCKKSNHLFRDCPEPRKKFCFKCGKENLTVRTCPTCKKN